MRLITTVSGRSADLHSFRVTGWQGANVQPTLPWVNENCGRVFARFLWWDSIPDLGRHWGLHQVLWEHMHCCWVHPSKHFTVCCIYIGMGQKFFPSNFCYQAWPEPTGSDKSQDRNNNFRHEHCIRCIAPPLFMISWVRDGVGSAARRLAQHWDVVLCCFVHALRDDMILKRLCSPYFPGLELRLGIL